MKIKHILGYTTTALLAMGIGIGMGGSATPGAAPTPPVTVTHSVSVPVIRTVVPDVCRRALDEADQGFKFAGDALQAAGNGFNAVVAGQVDGVNQAAAQMQADAGRLNRLSTSYRFDRDACTSS